MTNGKVATLAAHRFLCSRRVKIGAIAALAVGLAGTAKADLIFEGTGTASDGDAIHASVDFSLSGNTLTVVLTNLAKPTAQGSVLTNLGWTVAPNTATALPSASGSIALTSGSSLVSGTTVDNADPLGTEWEYTAGSGAASSGFGVGLANGHGNLCGNTVCNGAMLDGSSFGLVGAGTDLTPNGLKPANTYVEDSVTITLALAASPSFTLANITAAEFQFGTQTGEGDIMVPGCTGGSDCKTDPVPEPGSLVVLGSALAAFGLYRRRKSV